MKKMKSRSKILISGFIVILLVCLIFVRLLYSYVLVEQYISDYQNCIVSQWSRKIDGRYKYELFNPINNIVIASGNGCCINNGNGIRDVKFCEDYVFIQLHFDGDIIVGYDIKTNGKKTIVNKNWVELKCLD